MSVKIPHKIQPRTWLDNIVGYGGISNMELIWIFSTLSTIYRDLKAFHIRHMLDTCNLKSIGGDENLIWISDPLTASYQAMRQLYILCHFSFIIFVKFKASHKE